MLQLTNGSIVETPETSNRMASMQANYSGGSNTLGGLGSNALGGISFGSSNCYPYQTHWYSYPVYVCTDKTAKAIEILKALQAANIMLEIKSVPKFIELVEKISGIL